MNEPDAAHFYINKLKNSLGSDDAILEEALALIKTELPSSLETVKKFIETSELAELKLQGINFMELSFHKNYTCCRGWQINLNR
jgi:hypothetical protein